MIGYPNMDMDNFGHAVYTDSMSAHSAMVYLRKLRELHGFKRPEFERRSGIDRKKVYRWEQEGKTFPDMAELSAFAKTVQASFVHLEILLQESDVSEAAAEGMAEDRWEELQDPNASSMQEAFDLIVLLRAHPVLLGRWLEYGERLIAAAGDNQ